MKNNPLTTILLAALAISAIWSAILCVQLIRNSGEMRAMQGQLMFINNRQTADTAVLNEAVEYSKKNPAIDPILEALGIKTSAAAATPGPALKPANH